jgi:signal transduction histidine kinase
MGDEFFDALGYSPTFRFDGPVDSAVPDTIAVHVLSVVREGLANIAKHAGSPVAEVRIGIEQRADGSEVLVALDDAGRGLVEGGSRGHGLANLTARATELGGSFEVLPRPGGGTSLRWRVPLCEAGR